jgi:S-formylglutathione hydrolase FrmB
MKNPGSRGRNPNCPKNRSETPSITIKMKNFSLLLLVLPLAIHGYAQNQGRVLEGLEMDSKILKKDVNYSIYLPFDYESSSRSYPVVYLLHGYTDDETAWVQFGEVNVSASKAIAAGEMPAMIIVMPDGGTSFYINNYNSQVRWEDMFIQEFIPYIESRYRIRQKREFRGISGLSMGGYGATLLAMRHPELFVACAPFSSAYRTDEEMIEMDAKNYEARYGNVFGNLTGKKRLTGHWYKNSALHLAKTLPVEQLKSVRWYIDCGDDDFLYKGNSTMHIILRDRGIPHEYRVRDGGHNWTYWRTGIKDALVFIGRSFRR